MTSRDRIGAILTGVLLVARLRPTDDPDGFRADVERAIDALASQPGHIRTRLGRALDEPSRWVLVSEWENVGSYRRALSSYGVKMASGVLMGAVIDEATAYDALVDRSSGAG
jgi:quinol monooxygenase YgiN